MAPKMLCANSGVSDKNTPDSCDAFLPTCGRGYSETPLSRKGSTLFSCGLALILYPILKYETSLILATRMLFKDIYCACRNFKWKLNSSF